MCLFMCLFTHMITGGPDGIPVSVLILGVEQSSMPDITTSPADQHFMCILGRGGAIGADSGLVWRPSQFCQHSPY